MSTATATVITPEQAAEMYKTATTSASKWAFLDGVAAMVAAHPDQTQKEVVDMIGDTATFIAMHGHHRDQKAASAKAKSKLKSIRDELSVVKVWPAADRVDGVSFEAHKVLNRLGSKAGNKILTSLVKEMGGHPGNVTKAAVVAKLRVADPDHKAQPNGKTPASGNQPVTGGAAGPVQLTVLDMAQHLANTITVGDLSKDTALAAAVEKIADVFEAFSQRKAKVAAAKSSTPAPTPAKAAAKKAPAHKPKASAKPQVKRPAVKSPNVRVSPSKVAASA